MNSIRLAHRMIEAMDWMPSGWCGGCDYCGSAPMICAGCSYDTHGPLDRPVLWPCSHACGGAEKATAGR
jgi:hypothetical protein